MYSWKKGECHAHLLWENLEFHEYSINVNFMDVRRTEDSIFLRTEWNITSTVQQVAEFITICCCSQLRCYQKTCLLSDIIYSRELNRAQEIHKCFDIRYYSCNSVSFLLVNYLFFSRQLSIDKFINIYKIKILENFLLLRILWSREKNFSQYICILFSSRNFTQMFLRKFLNNISLKILPTIDRY